MKKMKTTTTFIITTLIILNASFLNVLAFDDETDIILDENTNASLDSSSSNSLEEKHFVDVEISSLHESKATDDYYAQLFTTTPINVEQTEFAITGFNDPTLLSSDGVLTIPNTINDQTITTIKKNAFIRNSQITKLIVSEGIITIDDSAFEGNSNLSEVILPSSIKKVGSRSFMKTQLYSINLPENLEIIGDLAFASNKISNLSIPASVYSIRNQAFAYNELTTLTIPSTVTDLHRGAFAHNKLTHVDLPEGMTTIPDSLFSMNQLTEIVFPSTITTIEQYAFSGNESLKEVTIPDHITFIGASAFLGCGIERLSLPNTLETLGAMSFMNNSLTSVTLPESISVIATSTFANNQITEVIIPANIEEIQWDAFMNNQISIITIPGTVTTVRANAFAGNPITYYTIESGVKFIESNAFLGLDGYLLGGIIGDSVVGESDYNNYIYNISTTPKYFILNNSTIPLSYATHQDGLVTSMDKSTNEIDSENWRASRTENIPTKFIFQEGVSQISSIIPSRWESTDNLFNNYKVSLVDLDGSYIIDSITNEKSTTLYALSFSTKQEVLQQLENTIPVKPGYTFVSWNIDNMSMDSFEEFSIVGLNDVYLLKDITGIYPIFEKDPVDNVIDGGFVIPNTGKR